VAIVSFSVYFSHSSFLTFQHLNFILYFHSSTDILLNVFLAIAVDNLADAESLTAIEKEDEEDEEEEEMVEKSKEQLEEEERLRKIRRRRRRRRRKRMLAQKAAGNDIQLDDMEANISESEDDDDDLDDDDGEDDDDDYDSDEFSDESDSEEEIDGNATLTISAADKETIDPLDSLKTPTSNYSGARPRRLSELNISKKVPPIPKYSSFFIFSHTNSFRVGCHRLINHSYFGNIVLICILISSGMLAAEDPLNATSHRNIILNYFDWFFTAIFTIEITLKTITFGVLLHRGSFCRSYSNLLDILVVCCSLISFGFP